MKKNFLKKLAFTMAFATAFTALSPAAGVFAAAKPSLTVGKTLTLLLGTDRAENDINVKNKVKGSKYAWTTSNKAVATVDKNGVVVAKKTGTAKVTLKITLPTKKTQTLTTTVNVKDNIKEVAISNADKLPEALAIGEEFDFNRTIVSTFGGNKTAHKGAVTRWVVTDAEGKATETATANDSGVFVATAPGEYLVKAVSFQSKAKYADFLKGKDTVTATSEAVKVVVANTVELASQYNLNSVDLTFKAPLTADEAKALDVHVNYVIGGVNIQEQKIKAKTLSADKKAVNVELYDPFVQEGTYRVTVGDKVVGEFKAAKVSVDEVENIGFATSERVTVNEITALSVNLYNKDGVIINKPASAATANLEARVDYKQAEDSFHLTYLYGNQLSIYKVNDTATVTATFHTYTYEGYNEIVKTAVRTFVGVDAPSDTAKEIISWTIGTVGADNTPNWKDAPKFIAAEDTGRKLYVKLKLQDNKEYVNEIADDKIKLTSSNSAILFVDELGNLNPVREGQVTVTVEYNKLYVGHFTVDVRAKRQVAALTLDKVSARLSNANGLNDDVTVEAKVVDQYGDEVSGLGITATSITTPTGDATKGYVALGNTRSGNKFTFNANWTVPGNHTVRFEHAGNVTLTRVFNILVEEPNSEAVSWKLEMDAEHNLIIEKANDVNKVQAISLFGYAKNGVKVSREGDNDFAIEVVNPKGQPHTQLTNSVSGFGVDLITTTSGGVLVEKADLGTYTITAKSTKVIKDAAGNTIVANGTPVARGAFKAVDTQAKPSVEVIKFETNATTKADAVAEAFNIWLKDVKRPIANADIEVTGTAVKTRYRIDNVYVNETIDGLVLRHKVAVGYYVTVSPNFVY